MLAPKRGNAPQRGNGGRSKGFTISSPTDGGDDDDDEWISSSSGAVTPNNHDSDSETASENDPSDSAPIYTHHSQPQPTQPDQSEFSPLQRVDTARPSEFMPSTPKNAPRVLTPPPAEVPPHNPRHYPEQPPHPIDQPDTVNQAQEQLRHLKIQNGATEANPKAHLHARHPHTKRTSRPPSTYSNSGKSDVRPHPLIRGQSFGRVDVGKPSPLAPLTLAAPPQLSTSPSSTVYEDPRNFLPSSPASSTVGSFTDRKADRRTSFSSARSVNTVPTPMFRPEPTRVVDRNRTLSAMSTTSSSAALSALSHLPAVTRPPSPQSVVFFPPVNPHANVENIHPLLPGPYLHNHLTVLSRRIPLRESYDRVIRAKQAM